MKNIVNDFFLMPEDKLKDICKTELQNGAEAIKYPLSKEPLTLYGNALFFLLIN